MVTTLWSTTRTFTATGPLSGTSLLDVTDSGIVPNDVVMPTHIVMPFTGFIVTQLAEIPQLPFTVTLDGSVTPVPSGSGVGLSVYPMWRNDSTGNGTIATNGLAWFSLNFGAGHSTASTTYDLPEKVPFAMFGGTGANEFLTHWLWLIGTADSVTYTVTITCSFTYEVPCWDGVSYQSFGAGGGSVINVTPNALPTGPTVNASIPGVGSVTAVAIGSVSNLTITNSMDTRPSGEVDVVLATFDNSGTIVKQTTLAAFTASVSSWRGVDVSLIATETYWYLYIVNSAGESHDMAVNVRYYCAGIVFSASGSSYAAFGLAFTTPPRLAFGRSFGRVIG